MRIWRKLRVHAARLPGRGTDARKAVAAELSYIRARKSKMRYATHYAAKLPIGSGATESTCWQMQQRVKLPGQSWDKPGLRGVLAMRALVLSDRWLAAWTPYAATHRKEIRSRPDQECIRLESGFACPSELPPLTGSATSCEQGA